MFEIVAVTNRLMCEGDFIARIEGIAASGAQAVILREKDLSPYEYERLAMASARCCAENGAELIAHSFATAALRAGCVRIQLPLAAFEKEQKFYRNSGGLRAGVSVHSSDEALRAVSLGARWLIAGHIFETASKKGLPPRGLRFLEGICRISAVPVYAIGGISARNIGEVMSAGAAGACVMSAFMKEKDLAGLVKSLIK